MSIPHDKDICEIIDIYPSTFSRWKKERPELHKRIKQSFECEAKLNELELSLKDALKLLEDYKK